MSMEYYEIVGELQKPDVTIGNTWLRRVTLTEAQERAVMAEIGQWDLIRDVKGYEELYWHDNDIIDHSAIYVIAGFWNRGVIVRDGHFYGAVVHTTDSASMGLSVTKWKDTGLVCIDGFHDGKTTEHESHGSDEVWWSHDATYYLQRKE